jgi:large subunit ribosomal protein L29
MKALKTKDLKDKTVEELKDLALVERALLYKMRHDLVFRQITDTRSLAQRRHNIARILTVMNEKKRGNA